MATIKRSHKDSLWNLYVKELREDAFEDGLELVSEHVVIEAFRPIPSRLWTPLTVQLLPSVPARTMCTRGMEMDLQMTKSEFLQLFPLWRAGAIHAWFLSRPCPDTLRVLDLPEATRHQILAPLGFTLEFTWPLPAISDWASFASPREQIIDRLELAFTPR